MAVKLPSTRTTFLQAIREFPRWLSIRKRPEKATSGLFLQSIVEEQTDIVAELEKFIKEFFLISYVGKESTIADYVYILQVGIMDYKDVTLIKPVLDITVDPKVFLESMDVYALYQEDYLIISTNTLPSDGILSYSYNGYKYGGKLQRYHIWNIFDEFAMFLGLERFTDTGETNEQLLKRCFLVFTNPTNSTAIGLKNVIMNCLSNDINLERNDIIVEIPNDYNMFLPYGNTTVYEHLIKLNKDIYRSKIWDSTLWEHNFKQLDYLSHVWDKKPEVYQDGTGQLNDLTVSLSQNNVDTTNVTVKGFKRDKIKVNEYFHKQNIRDEIPLQLLRYNNLLDPKNVQYKIVATSAIQIHPEQIYLKEQIRTEGVSKHYLQDIISSESGITVVNPGLLDRDVTYELDFKPRDEYSDMRINKLMFVDGTNEHNLLQETRTFKFNGGYLVHKDVAQHVIRTSELKTYTNLIDTLDGFKMGDKSNVATFSLDVTGCGGKTLKISSYGTLFDLTEQDDLWQCSGLKLDSNLLRSSTTVPDNGTATLTMSCMGYQVKLLPCMVGDVQGSVDVKVYVDGKINATLSKLIVDPTEPLEHWFDILTDVKIVFTKSGSYPFSAEVKGSRYELTFNLSAGEVIKGPIFNYLSDVPNTTPNTLTVTITNYDVTEPTIRYVHVGPTTSRTTYTVKNILPTTDNSYLDIDTVCRVYLYEIRNGERILVSDDFVTKKRYLNRTDDNIYLEVNLQKFTEILSSSVKISKTARYGKTVSYIIIAPGEEVSYLVISGVIYHDRARRTLDELLKLEPNCTVYVAGNADGFIVRNPGKGTDRFERIKRKDLTEATIFSYEELPFGISGVFVIDRSSNVRLAANSSNRGFDDTFLTVTEPQQYIAYNEILMYKPIIGDLENLEIIPSMFYPALPTNEMMFYQISVINNENDEEIAVAVFKKLWNGIDNYFGISCDCRKALRNLIKLINAGVSSAIDNALSTIKEVYGKTYKNSDNLLTEIQDTLTQGSWSLGRKEIQLTAMFDTQTSEAFATNVQSISPVFNLSNEIQLLRYITIGEEQIDLCTCVIKPPSYLKVVYDKQDDIIENNLIVESDGFYKLKYSNIVSVQQVVVNKEVYYNYDILPEEGIIVWKDRSIIGQYFSIAYTYKVPTSLMYTDLSHLYDKINYNTDALIPVALKSKIQSDYKDGELFFVEWQEPVDYVAAPECDNPNFIATYNNGTVTVKRVHTDNVALVNAGYYYDDGEEYYFYNNDYVDNMDKYSNIEFHNVRKLDIIFQFMIATINYLIHSDFKATANYEKLCYVNFTDSFIETEGISRFNEITAQETFNMWRNNNMTVSLVQGLRDVGLLFTTEDKNSWAAMNITKYCIPKMVISAFTTNDIILKVYKEIKADDEPMVKTIFAEPFDIFIKEDNFQTYVVPDNMENGYQYYLVVNGTGIVDDIIARFNVNNIEELHTKNLDNLGFLVEEKEAKGTLLCLNFERDGCILNSLELTKDNTIQIGTNVDYGVTRVLDSNKCYDDFTADETVIRRKGTFIMSDKKGWIRSPWFYLENNANVVDLYIKVNNLISGSTKNFDIKLRTSDNELGLRSKELGCVQKTNLAHFSGSQLDSYLQIEIEADPNKVIDTVEIFVRYGERSDTLLIIQDYLEGDLVTKIYDTITVGNYCLKKIEGTFTNKEFIKVSMRGCKQDSSNMVWTPWYDIELNSSLETIFTPHVFNDYRLFQFKISFTRNSAKAKIDNFILEVV